MDKDSRISISAAIAFALVAVLFYAIWHDRPKPDIDMRFGHAYFRGIKCTEPDCSTHVAGYKWATEHDVDDEGLCKNESESLVEGCRMGAFEVAERHEREAEYEGPGR